MGLSLFLGMGLCREVWTSRSSTSEDTKKPPLRKRNEGIRDAAWVAAYLATQKPVVALITKPVRQ